MIKCEECSVGIEDCFASAEAEITCEDANYIWNKAYQQGKLDGEINKCRVCDIPQDFVDGKVHDAINLFAEKLIKKCWAKVGSLEYVTEDEIIETVEHMWEDNKNE